MKSRANERAFGWIVDTKRAVWSRGEKNSYGAENFTSWAAATALRRTVDLSIIRSEHSLTASHASHTHAHKLSKPMNYGFFFLFTFCASHFSFFLFFPVRSRCSRSFYFPFGAVFRVMFEYIRLCECLCMSVNMIALLRIASLAGCERWFVFVFISFLYNLLRICYVVCRFT